jgi:hypothetical protein
MLAIFQAYLDAVEPYLVAGHYRSLERVLEGFSTNTDAFAICCCDGAREILAKPISLRERQKLLHQFIIDAAPSSHSDDSV